MGNLRQISLTLWGLVQYTRGPNLPKWPGYAASVSNEYLFLAQVVLIMGFSFAALKAGRDSLMAWVAIQTLIANLFVLKQISLVGLRATASDAFVVGSFAGLNFLQEYFGQESAKKATWLCFFSMIFFSLVSQLHLLYEPAPHDATQRAFETLLSPSPRLLAASMGAFFVVQRSTVFLFDWLQRAAPWVSFTLRSAFTMVLAQVLDTVLFGFFGLYGLVASLTEVIFVSLTVKLIAVSAFTLFVRWTSCKLSVSS